MKKVSLLFIIAFSFFLIGQVLWTIGLFSENPLFGSKNIEDWIINIIFTLCSLFGLIGSIYFYNETKKIK